MDKIKQVIKYTKNLSIMKSFIFYILIFLLPAILLSIITHGIYEFFNSKIEKNFFTRELFDFLETWPPIIYIIMCTILATFLFYKNKINKPIDILVKASEKITKNDLNFKICYDSNDEMGMLCNTFEEMRFFIENYNRKIWRSIEERKLLNTAFAHDLRTPLTVLKGYNDLTLKYLEKGVLEKDKLISTILTMSIHIQRLEKYVDSMNKLQKLDDTMVDEQLINTKILKTHLKESAEILIKNTNLKLKFIELEEKIERELYLDTLIINQVFENIISNAIKFAHNEINIRFYTDIDKFQFSISDDGQGFSKEDIDKATNPFYKGTNSKNGMGLGLNICKILLEIHDGKIILENNHDKGAIIKVSFKSW